jgi:TPR repeat protein
MYEYDLVPDSCLGGIAGRNKMEMVKGCYEQSAKCGNADAMVDLAYLYEQEMVPSENPMNEAIKLLGQARGLGNARAMNNLAMLLLDSKVGPSGGTANIAHSHGDDERQITQTAVNLLKDAVAVGYPKAMTNLGVCYLNGVGVEKCDVEARQFFTAAAHKKDALAMYYVGYLKLKGAFLKDPDNTDFSLTEYAECADLFRYVVDREPKNDHAHYYLGYLYQNGLGVDQDNTTALRYYWKAVKLSGERNSLACFKLGMLYTGNGQNGLVERDRAVYWFQKAADMDEKNACNVMGVMHERGDENVVKDYQKAFEYYTKGAQLGSLDAKFNLGSLLLNTKDTAALVEKDGNSAVSYILDAAAKGNCRAIDIIQHAIGKDPNWNSNVGTGQEKEGCFSIFDLNKGGRSTMGGMDTHSSLLGFNDPGHLKVSGDDKRSTFGNRETTTSLFVHTESKGKSKLWGMM